MKQNTLNNIISILIAVIITAIIIASAQAATIPITSIDNVSCTNCTVTDRLQAVAEDYVLLYFDMNVINTGSPYLYDRSKLGLHATSISGTAPTLVNDADGIGANFTTGSTYYSRAITAGLWANKLWFVTHAKRTATFASIESNSGPSITLGMSGGTYDSEVKYSTVAVGRLSTTLYAGGWLSSLLNGAYSLNKDFAVFAGGNGSRVLMYGNATTISNLTGTYYSSNIASGSTVTYYIGCTKGDTSRCLNGDTIYETLLLNATPTTTQMIGWHNYTVGNQVTKSKTEDFLKDNWNATTDVFTTNSNALNITINGQTAKTTHSLGSNYKKAQLYIKGNFTGISIKARGCNSTASDQTCSGASSWTTLTTQTWHSSLLVDPYVKNITYTPYNTSSGGSGGTGSAIGVILNLTFNNQTNCLKDYSTYNHNFTTSGTISCGQLSSHDHWYGYLNDTAAGTNYIRTNIAATNITKMAIATWVYYPGTITNTGFFDMGNTTTRRKYTAYSGYCFNPHWYAYGGEISLNTYSSGCISSGNWYYVFQQYNKTKFTIYIKGPGINYTTSASSSYGNLTHIRGDKLLLGYGYYDANMLLDEVIVWNRANFTAAQVQAIYDAQKYGTPPDLDLIIVNNSRWQSTNTTYIKLRTIVKNKGITNNSGNFNITFYNKNNIACNIRTSLAPGASYTAWCNTTIPTSGVWVGNVTIDRLDEVNEDAEGGDENDNTAIIIIDTRNHPRLMPKISSTYYTNSSNYLAYGVYNQRKPGTSAQTDYSSGYSASDVDYHAREGWLDTITCVLGNYASSTQCTHAKNHLAGWLNSTRYTNAQWAAASTQSVHDLEWVALIYDWMWPNLTTTQKSDYAKRMGEICIAIISDTDVSPQEDDDSLQPENGKGFGTGFATTCLAVLGDYPSNPMTEYTVDGDDRRYNAAYLMLKRLERHTASNGNSSGCAEGILYCNYEKYHTVNALWYDDNASIINIVDNYNGDICGVVKTYAEYLQDSNYVGSTLRGADSNTKIRWYSPGDSYSYDTIGEVSEVGAALITGYASLCKNTTTRSVGRRVREYLYSYGYSSSVGWANWPSFDLFYSYNLTRTAAATATTQQAFMGYLYDAAYDDAYWRKGFTYTNDTQIVCRGGTKESWGHPHAQFSCDIYAMGEPFRDQTQVAYEDDTRSERWKNTMSYSDSTATGYCAENSLTPPLNQQYCGTDYPLLSMYPVIEHTLAAARGSHEAWGTSNGKIGASRMIQPYTGDDKDPERLQIQYDDTIIYVYKVDRTGSGRWQENIVNIYGEFTPTISGTNLTFQRAGTLKYFKMTVLNTTKALTLTGGNSTVRYGKDKTVAPAGKGYYGHYKYYTDSADAETIGFIEHWYYGTDTVTIKKVTSGNDIGVNRSGVIMLIDTAGDGISYSGLKTNSWSLILNGTHIGISNATWLYNGTSNNTYATKTSGMITLGYVSTCTPAWTNTSWSDYTYTDCTDETRIYTRYRTTYDANSCTITTTRYYDNTTVTCETTTTPSNNGGGSSATTEKNNKQAATYLENIPTGMMIWLDAKELLSEYKLIIGVAVIALLVALAIGVSRRR